MERKIPTQGSFYRHFRGNIYQIKEIAMQSNTGEKAVVYQAMAAPFSVWVTPLGSFLSEVDVEKYPDTTQRYCFQEIMYQNRTAYFVGDEWPKEESADNASSAGNDAGGGDRQAGNALNADIMEEAGGSGEQTAAETEGSGISDAELKRILLSGQAERKLDGVMSAEEIGSRGFMIFLDAESYHERKEIFMGLKPYLNDFLLHNIAVSMDVALEEGTFQESYESILHCMNAYEKYEGGRLR